VTATDMVLILRWPEVDGPAAPAYYYGPLEASEANHRAEQLAARSDHPAVSVEVLRNPAAIPVRGS
jgi:hypothetical protein